MDGGSVRQEENEAYFPASLAQTRFWLLDALEPGSPSLNVAVQWTLLGAVTPEDAGAAWRHIIERHEVLRTALRAVDGVPIQFVSPAVAFHVDHQDLSAMSEPERLFEADRLGLAAATTPIELGIAPLMRVSLITLAPGISRMLLTLHHAVCDGWSIGVLAHEFTAALASVALPALPIQYGDYAEWQQAWLASPTIAAAETYWLQQLANLPYVTVPPDFLSAERGGSEIISALLPRDVSDVMSKIAVRFGCTDFVVALAALGRVLQARTATGEIVIGTQLANRTEVELEPMVGCFINTLVIRLDFADAPSWESLVERTASTVLEALHYGEMPFEALIQALNPRRERGRTPLFSVNLIFQRSFVRPSQQTNVTLIDMPSHPAGALYDLNFFMVERPDGWRASCEYDTSRYERSKVEAMLADWEKALTGVSIDASLSSPTIARLAVLWRDVLSVQSVAQGDNFFEMGGHSLLAARLLSRVEATFGRRITMANLFADPTLGGLARRLENGDIRSSESKLLSQAGSPTAIVALGALNVWEHLAAAFGPSVPFLCMQSPTADDITACHPNGRLSLIAAGQNSIEALTLAEALQQRQRNVLLVLINAATPHRLGLFTRLRRAASPRRFQGKTLLFCAPDKRDASGDWSSHLAGKLDIISLPPSPWEKAVTQHITAALF